MADAMALQQQVQQLQQMSQQLQAVAQQRQQFEGLKQESEQAISVLEDLDGDATVYRNIGSLLVKDKGRDEAVARIKDDMETLDVRIKRVKGQEDELRKALEALQTKLQAEFAKQQASKEE